MVPPISSMLPNFVLIKQLGLLNTYPGIILPFFFMTPSQSSSCASSFSHIGTDKAKAAFEAKDIDVTRFTVQVDDKTTFLFPIQSRSGHPTDHEAGDLQRGELLRRSSFVDRR